MFETTRTDLLIRAECALLAPETMDVQQNLAPNWPRSHIDHPRLQYPPSYAQARDSGCGAGNFRIYAVETLDEGIEILTGHACGGEQEKFPRE